MSTLSFSGRASAAFVVFACIGVASQNGAAELQTSATPVQRGQLSAASSQLVAIYHQIIHQDVANPKAVLYGLIALAVTTVGNLLATLNSLTAIGDAFYALQNMQTIAANALAVLNNVTLDEN